MGKGINEFAITCNGNTLSLYINGVETHVLKENKLVLRDGQVGIGVASSNVLPIKMEIDWIAIIEIIN